MTVAMPEFGEIAARLAGLADSLEGAENPFRDGLRRVRDLLAGPSPSILEAQAEIFRALACLLKPGGVIDKPETWLFCACAACLFMEKVRLAQTAQPAPKGAQLQ